MPLTKSAKKRVKQSEKRRLRNKMIKTYIKNLKKKTLELLNSSNAKKEDLINALNFYKSQVDKTWAKGVFKRNKASRLKSRMEILFNKRLQEKNI